MSKTELSAAAKLIAKKGGVSTLRKYGKKHYRLMAKKRWARARLIRRDEILKEEIQRDYQNDNRPEEN